MARQRTTEDEWIVQGNYGYSDGWEDLTTETTRKEGVAALNDYNRNDPTVPHRLIMRRVKKEEPTTS